MNFKNECCTLRYSALPLHQNGQGGRSAPAALVGIKPTPGHSGSALNFAASPPQRAKTQQRMSLREITACLKLSVAKGSAVLSEPAPQLVLVPTLLGAAGISCPRRCRILR